MKRKKTKEEKLNLKDRQFVTYLILKGKKTGKCPRCELRKEGVYFIHKDMVLRKNVFELFLCKECLRLLKTDIMEEKITKRKYLVPVLNTMLEVIGEWDELEAKKMEENLNLVENLKTIKEPLNIKNIQTPEEFEPIREQKDPTQEEIKALEEIEKNITIEEHVM